MTISPMNLLSLLLAVLLAQPLNATDIARKCCSEADCGDIQTCNIIPTDKPCNITDPRASGRCGINVPAGCFARDATMEVLDKGPTFMQDLKVGDLVKVSSNGLYEPIYAFGHHDPTSRSDEYLEIQHTGGGDDYQPLRMTRDHLIKLASHSTSSSCDGPFRYVPAASLRVGDQLECGMAITAIHPVTALGLYAPLVTSGRLMVGGVSTSCYISLQRGLPEYLEMSNGSWQTPLSQHWFTHVGLSPIRLLCLGIAPGFCSIDQSIDHSTGYAWFAGVGFAMVNTMEQHCFALQMLFMGLFFLVFGWFWIVELLLGAVYAPTIIGFLFVGIFARTGSMMSKVAATKGEESDDVTPMGKPLLMLSETV